MAQTPAEEFMKRISVALEKERREREKIWKRESEREREREREWEREGGSVKSSPKNITIILIKYGTSWVMALLM